MTSRLNRAAVLSLDNIEHWYYTFDMSRKDIDKYEQRARLLREKLTRQKVEVRDVVRVLDLSGPSHALYIMRKMAELGYLEYDAPQGDASYGDYYFPAKGA